MMFRSFKPAAPLSGFIENLWLYDGYSSPSLRERIFPSGTFELVFNLRDDELRIYRATNPDQCTRFSGAIVSGPYGGHFITDRREEVSVMGVHFKAGGAFPFLGFAADELVDTHVNLRDIWGRTTDEIHEHLSSEWVPARQFRLLEEELIARQFRPLEHHPAVSRALERVRITTSRSLIRNLVRDAGLSKRRFIDVFNFQVGIKPKLFERIQRFQRVLRVLHRSQTPEWEQLALEHGYYDQSHMIHDFLEFSGFSPADYLQRLEQLRRCGTHVKFNHLPSAQ